MQGSELASGSGFTSFLSRMLPVKHSCSLLVTLLCISENKAEEWAARCSPGEGTSAVYSSCTCGAEEPSVLQEGAAADPRERCCKNYRGQQHSRQSLQWIRGRVLESWACCCQLGVWSGQDDLLIKSALCSSSRLIALRDDLFWGWLCAAWPNHDLYIGKFC